MNQENGFENHIYSIAIPVRNFDERHEEDGKRQREGIAWFIPNSPPLPNDTANYRRYRRGIDRQQEIEIMLMGHQWHARRGPGRARVVPQCNVKEQVRMEIFDLPSVNNGDGLPRWSLFQVWNNLAYVTCSVPFRVAWEDQQRRYVLKYSRIQQVFYGIQQILSSAEMISWWRQFADLFSNDTNHLLLCVQFGYLVLTVTTRICYMKTTLFGMDDLLQVHTHAVNSRAATGYRIKMARVMTITAFTGYSMYLCGYLSLNLALYTLQDQGDWNWGPAEFLQTFACHARKVFVWATVQDCPDDIFFSLKMLPWEEILNGCFGLLTYVSGILTENHSTLMIVSSCLTLLSASNTLTSLDKHRFAPQLQRKIRHADKDQEKVRPVSTRYQFLERFAGKISSFVGLIFLVALGVIGLSLPNTLDTIFNHYELSAVAEIMQIVMMIIACLGACLSAMQIDALEEKLTSAENIEELPNEIRRLVIYLHRLFKRSAGIGYRGLFVMNFAYLISYCGAIAGFVVFTHETKKQDSPTT